MTGKRINIENPEWKKREDVAMNLAIWILGLEFDVFLAALRLHERLS